MSRLRLGSTSLVLLALSLVAPAAAHAQQPAGSFDQFVAAGTVRPGDTVYVTDADGRTVHGTLASVDAGGLALDTGLRSRRRTFAPAEIQRVERADSLANGLLIGLGAGAAAALLSPHALCTLPDSECEVRAFAFVGIPLAVGATVASLLVDRAHRPTVFRRAAGTAGAHVVLAPLFRAGAPALVVSVLF